MLNSTKNAKIVLIIKNVLSIQTQRQRTLDEATNLLNAVAGEYGSRSAGEVMSPYMDKNEELGGQRVDHMRSMFEPKNIERQQPAWRRNGVGTAAPKSTPRKPALSFEEEGNYYEISDLLKVKLCVYCGYQRSQMHSK